MKTTMRATALGVLSATLVACATQPASDPSELARVVATNEAFDAALSRRDIAAIDAAWAQDGTVTAIHPASKAPAVGWEAVHKSWEGAFANFPELSVALADPQVRITGSSAFVVGVETIRGRRPSGEQVEFFALTTNVYEKRGDRWLMVHHQASRSPP